MAPVSGYFHAWEDWALFVLFVFFTYVKCPRPYFFALIPHRLEAFARICVSGFLLDPEIPMSAFFSPSISKTSAMSPDPNPSVSRQPSLARRVTFRQRLRHMQRTIAQPFRLAPSASFPAPSHDSINDLSRNGAPHIPSPLEKAQQKVTHLRNPSQPNFFSKALRSDNSEVVSLPFRLNVASVHDKVHRNIPYLRQSWSRIDFVAITSFWISFVLSMVGVERGVHHIGLFRAMSVLRTARLLALSSGTTVSAFSEEIDISNCGHCTDHHALAEDRSSSPYECCVLCIVCDGFIFVRRCILGPDLR